MREPLRPEELDALEVRIDDWFAGEAARERTSTVAAGRTVDLRFELPESACEDEPAADARMSTVTFELEGGGTVTVPVADPLGFTTLIHEKECLRHDLARVATIEWAAFTPSAAPLPACWPAAGPSKPRWPSRLRAGTIRSS